MHSVCGGSFVSEAKPLYELKERAKWSRDWEEKKMAIKELVVLGEKALPTLEEIFNVTAYEDVKAICLDAIKSIREGTKKMVVGEQSSASTNAATTTADVKKKEQKKVAEGEASKDGPTLADLPP
jgi:hypothetical protein